MTADTSQSGGPLGIAARYFQYRFHKNLSFPRRILGRLHIDRNADPDACVLLVGSVRSGTTWLQEVINCRNEYRVLFEPFAAHRVGFCSHLGESKYLRPDEDDDEFLELVRRILSGRVRQRWIDHQNRKWLCRRRLVKTIRAHLFLKWLHVRFPRIPIVFLMRHPCATVVSQRQKGWWRYNPKQELLSQPALVDDFLAPVRDEMARAEDPFDRAVFQWCVENVVPLRQFREGDIHLAFYEHFCEDPEPEITSLFKFLGTEVDDRVFRALRRPSFVSGHHSAVVLGRSLTEAWRRRVSPEQTRRAVEILRLFGLDRIYDDSPMPNPDAAHDMLKQEG